MGTHTGQRAWVGTHNFDALPDAGTIELLIVTGQYPARFDLVAQTLGNYLLSVFEDTNSTGGTEITLENLNRTITTGMVETKIFSAPTVTGDGKNILDLREVGGTRKDRLVGESEIEFKMKSRAKYLLRLTNESGAADTGGLIFGVIE